MENGDLTNNDLCLLLFVLFFVLFWCFLDFVSLVCIEYRLRFHKLFHVWCVVRKVLRRLKLSHMQESCTPTVPGSETKTR